VNTTINELIHRTREELLRSRIIDEEHLSLFAETNTRYEGDIPWGLKEGDTGRHELARAEVQ